MDQSGQGTAERRHLGKVKESLDTKALGMSAASSSGSASPAPGIEPT